MDGLAGCISIAGMLRAHRLLAIALVVSCRPEPSSTPPHGTSDPHAHTPDVTTPTPTPDPAVTTRPAAEDALWTRLGTSNDDGTHAVIGRYKQVRIDAEGQPYGDGGDAPAFDTAEVLESQGDRIRVVTRGLSGWSSIALWVDEADMARQLSRPATVVPDPKMVTRPEDGTLEMAPGEMVDILEEGPTHAKIRTRDEAFAGWVPLEKLGPTYTADPFELPRFDAETKPGTQLSRTPGGKPFYKLADLPNGTHLVRVLTSPRGGWVQIEFVEPCRRTIRIRGWVRATSTKVTGEMAMGFGCSGGQGTVRGQWGDLEKAPSIKVPKDTELRTPFGVLFGRTRGEVELRQAADETWRLLTRWGAVPVAKPAG